MDELFEKIKDNPDQFRRGLELLARAEKEGAAALEGELTALACEAGLSVDGAAWKAALAELYSNDQDEQDEQAEMAKREFELLPEEALISTGMDMVE